MDTSREDLKTGFVPGLVIEEINGMISLTKCNSDAAEITIPEQVVYIDDDAFKDCRNLERIVIPDSVESMGWSVFSGCTSLKSVVLSHALKELPMDTFFDCSSLSDIIVPGNIKKIENACFYGCASLKNITLQVGVEQIGSHAFYGCESLEELILPEGFASLGNEPFERCPNLKKLVIPNTVTHFGYSPFQCEPGREEMTIYCSKDSYAACHVADSSTSCRLTDLEGDFFVKNGILLRYFGEDSVVVVPDGIEQISRYAFQDSHNITDLIVPESVKSIKHSGNLRSFLWGVTVHCSLSNEEVIKFCQKHGRTYELTGEDADIQDGVLIRYAGQHKIYRIPDGVNKIGPRAFQSSKSLEEVYFSESVTDIEDEAFVGCTELRKVVLSPRIEKISGRSVFRECSNLRHFEAAGLISFTWHIFRDCYRLCYFKMCPPDQIPEDLKNEIHMVPDIAKKEYSEEEMLAFSRIASQYSMSNMWDYYGEDPRTYNWEWFYGVEFGCDRFNMLDAAIRDGQIIGFYYVLGREWTVVGTDQVGEKIMIDKEPDIIDRKNRTSYYVLKKVT